jgi:hypothetical protein
MRTRVLRTIFISVGVLFALSRLLAAGTFTTFDPPGSTGTFPSGINPMGAITGSYNDASNMTHSFVRSPGGSITTFDGPNDMFGTQAFGINSAGVITGFYCDAINCHSFLRSRDGSFTTFDVPGAVLGTFPVGINDAGAVTGQYCDTVNCYSFLRTASGSFVTFDPAMVPNNSGVINPAGAVTGYFVTPDFLISRFVRDPKGNRHPIRRTERLPTRQRHMCHRH